MEHVHDPESTGLSGMAVVATAIGLGAFGTLAVGRWRSGAWPLVASLPAMSIEIGRFEVSLRWPAEICLAGNDSTSGLERSPFSNGFLAPLWVLAFKAGGRLGFPMVQRDTPRPAPGFSRQAEGNRAPPQILNFLPVDRPSRSGFGQSRYIQINTLCGEFSALCIRLNCQTKQ